MTRDVYWLLDNQDRWRFKALTENAKALMGQDMGGPYQLAKDIFWVAEKSKFATIISRLHGMGLTTEEKKAL